MPGRTSFGRSKAVRKDAMKKPSWAQARRELIAGACAVEAEPGLPEQLTLKMAITE